LLRFGQRPPKTESDFNHKRGPANCRRNLFSPVITPPPFPPPHFHFDNQRQRRIFLLWVSPPTLKLGGKGGGVMTGENKFLLRYCVQACSPIKYPPPNSRATDLRPPNFGGRQRRCSGEKAEVKFVDGLTEFIGGGPIRRGFPINLVAGPDPMGSIRPPSKKTFRAQPQKHREQAPAQSSLLSALTPGPTTDHTLQRSRFSLAPPSGKALRSFRTLLGSA